MRHCFTDLMMSEYFHALRRFSYRYLRLLCNMAENGVKKQNCHDKLRYGEQELKTEKVHHNNWTAELRFVHCHFNMGNASLHFLWRRCPSPGQGHSSSWLNMNIKFPSTCQAMQTSKCFIMKKKEKNNKKKSAEWKVSWERENTKVAHFSGVPTRRESIKEMHTQAVLRQTTWCKTLVVLILHASLTRWFCSALLCVWVTRVSQEYKITVTVCPV